MSSFFISYSRRDIEFARKLTGSLKSQNVAFWIDWEGIPPTVDWWKEIEKGIEETDAFLFLMSPDSIKSPVCRQEIEHASKNGKRLIPLVVRDIPANDAPPELGRLNWIFARDTDDFDVALNKLLVALKTDYEWVQSHRQLQVKALEWQRNNFENSLLLRGKELEAAETQLAHDSSKEPFPTSLQREYVLRSRQASERQRRTNSSIAAVTGVILVALTITAIVMAGRASNNAQEAQAASTLAVANALTAEANAEEAQRQSNIAFARQLGAQAKSVFSQGPEYQTTAVLLAIKSLQLHPAIDASQVLQNHTLAYPVVERKYTESVRLVAFSPDSKYVAMASGQSVELMEPSSGRHVLELSLESRVSVLKFSPNGRYLATGDFEGNIQVWDVSNGQEIVRMIHSDEYEKLIQRLTFSGDNKYLASTGRDSLIHIWEIPAGTEISRISVNQYVPYLIFSPNSSYISSAIDHTAYLWNALTAREVSRKTYAEPVSSAAFSPDGKHLVLGEGKLVHILDSMMEREISQIPLLGDVSVVAVSPDGKWVLTGGCDAACVQSSTRVWDVSTGNEVAHASYSGGIGTVAFSADGRWVASSGCDRVPSYRTCSEGVVRVWDVSTQKEIARMEHNNFVSSFAFSPDGRFLATGSDTGTVWEASNFHEINLSRQDSNLWSVDLSTDGRYVVGGMQDGVIAVWDTLTGAKFSQFRHTDYGVSVNFSPDGSYVVSGARYFLGLNKTARIWESFSGKEILQLPHDDSLNVAQFSPDGNHVAAGIWDTVQVWDATTGQETSRMHHEGSVTSLAFSPDGKYLVSGSYKETVFIWETVTGREIAQFKAQGPVFLVGYSPSNDLVYAGSCDQYDSNDVCIEGGVRIWEMESSKEVAHMTHAGAVVGIAFSQDGQYVASGGYDDTIVIWEAATGKEIGRLPHEGIVVSVSFSPNGKYLVSSSTDGTARVWEIETEQEIARLLHDGGAFGAEFSLDGKYVISSGSRNIRVWLWNPKDLIQRGCMAVQRNLTETEWKQYVSTELPYEKACDNLPSSLELTPAP